MSKAYNVWEKRGLAGEWVDHGRVSGSSMAEAAQNLARSQGYAGKPSAYTPGVYRMTVGVAGRVFMHFFKVEVVKEKRAK